MNKIEEVKVNGKRIFIKGGALGYSVVHPIKVDGKINWKNLIAGGSWIKLGILVLIVLIILGFINEHVSMLRMLNTCLELNSFPIHI